MEFFKKRTSFRFMPLRRRWYAISAALILASLLLIALRGLNLGIDFTGGVMLELSFPQEVDLDKVRGALASQGHEDATVQSFGTAREVLVRGGTTPEIRTLAAGIVEAQEREIVEMKVWYETWYGEPHRDTGVYVPMISRKITP